MFRGPGKAVQQDCSGVLEPRGGEQAWRVLDCEEESRTAASSTVLDQASALEESYVQEDVEGKVSCSCKP